MLECVGYEGKVFSGEHVAGVRRWPEDPGDRYSSGVAAKVSDEESVKGVTLFLGRSGIRAGSWTSCLRSVFRVLRFTYGGLQKGKGKR